MTKDQFVNTLNVIGGQFVFSTDQHEGMIGISPSNIVVWVDDKGFSKSFDESEPKNIGEFKSVKELLYNFNVDGKSFVDYVLPKISKLNQVYT